MPGDAQKLRAGYVTKAKVNVHLRVDRAASRFASRQIEERGRGGLYNRRNVNFVEHVKGMFGTCCLLAM